MSSIGNLNPHNHTADTRARRCKGCKRLSRIEQRYSQSRVSLKWVAAKLGTGVGYHQENDWMFQDNNGSIRKTPLTYENIHFKRQKLG